MCKKSGIKLNNLKKYRLTKHRTQVDAAKSIGISTRYYQSLEVGACVPRVDVALQCAKTYECKVEDLFY